MLKVYNTLSRKKELFKPLRGKRVAFYTCGPTVYGPSHIGHARTYIAFDIIRRYLEHKGYKVKFVMNITDIHDDIIKEASKQKTDIFSLSKKYTKIFLEDQIKLGIKKANVYPRVTEHIKEIIDFIKELEKKGFAYQKQGSVYFDISKFKDYGKLSNIKVKEAKTGTRVKTDKYEKEQAADFVLWKKARPGEPFWSSPWSNGRPGWHIECSVMSKKHLGEQIDIHGGAKDLQFPHHENELAQSETISEKKPFVKYWLHAGLLNIEGKKMSKSLKNFIIIPDVLKKWEPRVIRMFVASSHYRSELDWTEKNILQAKQGLERIDEFVEKLKTAAGRQSVIIDKLSLKTKEGFEKAMENDFNTSEALAIIFEFIRKANPILAKNKIGKTEAKKILAFLKEVDKIFNFIFAKKERKIPLRVQELVKKREALRKQKKWAEADKIRKQIERLGFSIKDTPKDTKIKKA